MPKPTAHRRLVAGLALPAGLAGLVGLVGLAASAQPVAAAVVLASPTFLY